MLLGHCSRLARAAQVTVAAGCFTSALILAPPVAADPTTAGHVVALLLSTHPQLDPTAILDGAGGAFVGFKVPQDDAYYAGHVDADGFPVPGWYAYPALHLITGVAGHPTHLATIEPDRVLLLGDNTISNTWLTRKIGPFGLTNPDTSLITRPGLDVPTFVRVADDRLLIVAKSNAELFLQDIAADGSTTVLPPIELPGQWTSFQTVGHFSTPIVSDGAGGFWVLCEIANTVTGADLVAVRLAADGSPLLTPAHRVVSNASRDQDQGALAPSGSNGMYSVWTDRRNILTQGTELFGLRLLGDGSIAPGWPTQGKMIASFAGDQLEPRLLPDGSGGVWLAWSDANGSQTNLMFTRLDANGAPAPGYAAGGRSLCSAPGERADLEILGDGSGGFYALWLDHRNGEFDLFGQHIHSTGVVMPGWTADGLPICTAPTDQASPGLLMLSPGHVLATWTDTRSGSSLVYAAPLPADDAITDAPRLPAGRLEVRSARDPERGAIELFVTAADVGPVRVTLHDVAGRTLAEHVLQSPVRAAAVHFDAAALEPGLYFARVSRAGATIATRVSLVR
jgi:hypothetical protein